MLYYGPISIWCDMIILIKHKVDWGLIPRQNQTQIKKYRIHENMKRFDHDYKVRDKFILTNNTA